MIRLLKVTLFHFCALLFLSSSAFAQTSPEIYSYSAAKPFCDVAYQNCRVQIINFIDAEPTGGSIDVAFWFMDDSRYATALIRAKNRGVRVRILFDTDPLIGNTGDAPVRRQIISDLVAAGIPIRHKSTGGILHWKLMIFGVQDILNFSAANFSPDGYVPWVTYTNYEDEVIAFTKDAGLVATFKSKYDDIWMTTNGYENYANVTVLERYHQTVAQPDSRLNFPPTENYATRAVGRYNRETAGIDVTMYRITDRRHSDAMIAAMERGVTVRLYTEPFQYRDPTRLWHAWNVDRMYMAGRDADYVCRAPNGNCIQIKHRAHDGLNHQKSVVLHGQRMVIFGSSNWTSPSASSQLEHNIFTTESLYYDFFASQFTQKWTSTDPAGRPTPVPQTTEFVPLPPDKPIIVLPANGATGQSVSGVTLKWNGGPWAHLYDIYLGTSPTLTAANLIATDLVRSPEEKPDFTHTFVTPPLQGGTTYYVRIVSKTMANKTATSSQWSFVTAGTSTPPAGAVPPPWLTQDVGGVAAPGNATFDNTTNQFAAFGSGADIWGSADEFRFVYQTLSGNGSITARVDGVTNEHAWTKAGVMMRNGVSAGAAHASMFVSSAKGLAFQRRTTAGGTSTSTAGRLVGAPYWVRITRSGNEFTASVRSDSSDWEVVGKDTIAMPDTIQVGLAVTSHLDGTVSRGTFSNVSVETGTTTPPVSTLPEGWESQDVGSTSPKGTASYDSATAVYTVTGAGADIWGTADAFHFASTTLDGDGLIIARVASVQNVDPWTKAGVMIRATTAANSAHAGMFVTPTSAKGTAFQRRPTTGGSTVHSAGQMLGAPMWVRLERSGSTITASTSTDNSTWIDAGSQTIALDAVVRVGLAVSSHRNGTLATATFDNVTVIP